MSEGPRDAWYQLRAAFEEDLAKIFNWMQLNEMAIHVLAGMHEDGIITEEQYAQQLAEVSANIDTAAEMQAAIAGWMDEGDQRYGR